MACDCISKCNNVLAPHNSALVTTLLTNPERVAIDTNKVDSKKRGRPARMIATFCPFCGERYGPGGAVSK